MLENEIKFNFSNLGIKLDLPKEISELFRFKEIERPSVWAEKHFRFGYGYGEPGPCVFEGREWQRDVVDAYMWAKEVIICGPVQVGKSVSGIDIPWAWWYDNVGGHSLITYADKDTVKDVFEERIRPSVKGNLSHLWSGNEDDLRQDKLMLLNGITRCASANVESDVSTFASDLVLIDELAKYNSSFDVVNACRGRQKSYQGMPGRHCIMGIVSSPKEHRDPLYNEIHKGGVLILRYRMPCPYCNHYHELVDENIKEIPGVGGELDHDPVRIRLERAARYECPNCKRDIADGDRWTMIKKGVWASDAEAEHIAPDGRIKKDDPLRGQTDAVCFWLNRLVSPPDKWGFADCLSSFFSARQSMDPKSWADYQNNDMARFIDPRASEISQTSLIGKQQDYFQFGEMASVPDDVIVITIGIDTQDNGFYYSAIGFGKNMESWRVRHDFIHCDMQESQYRDPSIVMECLLNGIMKPPYRYKDGRMTGPIYGFIDEGGHRQKDVHYICRHFPRLKAYKGSSNVNAEPIRKSSTDIHYMGNTQYWSEIVQNHMESDTFHLPKDTTKEYYDQITKQYWKEYADKYGRTKYTFISGRNDHYRDAENIAFAAAYQLNLPEKLVDKANLESLRLQAIHKAPAVGYAEITQDAGRAPRTEIVKNISDPFSARDSRQRMWRGRRQ